MKIAILGGGVAAFEAANSARKVSADAEITIYSAESMLPYRRPALSGMLADFKINEKMFFIKPESFYAENNISVKLNTRCVEIKEHELVMADGSAAAFDRLIIATGGKACLPAIPGNDRDNVYTFRNVADLEKLDKVLTDTRQAVIVGAGVLGLELAESMLKRNIKVTVLEMASRLFSRYLSEEQSAGIADKLKDFTDLHFEFNATATGITDAGVTLADNRTIPADIVIFAAGSRPSLPEKMPETLKVNRGILVDNTMQSSIPGIYAAGDAIEFEGKCFGLYNDARTTGIVAGNNAAGNAEEFKPAAATPVRCFCLGLKLVM